MAERGTEPFARPYRLDDAGWVANRWCEILPISSAAKQRLMALDEPVLRLQLVQDYLQGKGLQKGARVAIMLPNILQNLLGEGTLSASFIPVYAELLERGEKEPSPEHLMAP